jgi:aerobic-type carbon monoxide dehydrogenase small subunit (CoxS/CutS family)
MRVKITINGQLYERDVEPRLLLTHFIRDIAGLTGHTSDVRRASVGRVRFWQMAWQ